MKKNNKPTKNVAPAKAENKKLINRQRRIRRLVKLGLSEDKIQEIYKEESNRLILCLYYTSFSKDTTRVKKHYTRDKSHKVTNVTEEEVTVKLTGRQAAELFLKENNIEPIALGATYCYIKTDESHLEELLDKLKPIGRTSVTKPDPVEDMLVKKEMKNVKPRKPSGNKDSKKNHVSNKQIRDSHNMSPYYAVLRKMRKKGADTSKVEDFINDRVKKHNPKLAEDIKKWITSKAKTLDLAIKFKNKPASKSEEHRAKHRQLTSIEVKARKRAKKTVRHLAAIERLQARQKAAEENNKGLREESAQKAQKPVQTELKMAA